MILCIWICIPLVNRWNGLWYVASVSILFSWAHKRHFRSFSTKSRSYFKSNVSLSDPDQVYNLRFNVLELSVSPVIFIFALVLSLDKNTEDQISIFVFLSLFQKEKFYLWPPQKKSRMIQNSAEREKIPPSLKSGKRILPYCDLLPFQKEIFFLLNFSFHIVSAFQISKKKSAANRLSFLFQGPIKELHFWT